MVSGDLKSISIHTSEDEVSLSEEDIGFAANWEVPDDYFPEEIPYGDLDASGLMQYYEYQ